jgi:hypothetical protein
LLAGGGIEAVQLAVVRSHQHHVADHDRRGLDLGLRLEGPDRLAVGDVDRVHHADQIADEHAAVGDGRRGLADRLARLVAPAQLAIGEADRDQLAGRRPGIHHVIDDRRR